MIETVETYLKAGPVHTKRIYKRRRHAPRSTCGHDVYLSVLQTDCIGQIAQSTTDSAAAAPTALGAQFRRFYRSDAFLMRADDIIAIDVGTARRVIREHGLGPWAPRAPPVSPYICIRAYVRTYTLTVLTSGSPVPRFLHNVSAITYFMNGYLIDDAHANSLFLTRGKTTHCARRALRLS